MNQKVRIANGTLVTLTDKNYKAAGGEAAIYVHGNTVFKLYHEPKKKKLSPQKMIELKVIKDSHVVVPQELLFDATSGDPIGYTTTFVSDAHPLLKFFTLTFKTENNISPDMISELVKNMQQTVSEVHAASCLVVDLNELNVLVKINPSLEPWFIDTDSYATPSYKAVAIMDSVRDRRVSSYDHKHELHYAPDMLSDWFSWGILAFWLYTNIHPYRGKHPKYKPKDRTAQMDDGISVFHRDVRVPPMVNDFNAIPKRHLDWFKAVFLRNERSIPPLADSSVPLGVPAAFVTVSGTDQLQVTEVAAYPDPVMGVFEFSGVRYVVTKKAIYREKKEMFSFGKLRKVLLCAATDGNIIAASRSGTKVDFWEALSGVPVGSIAGADFFARNEAIYTVVNGKLVENSFRRLGTKITHRILEVENVSMLTTTLYDGCLIQDLLGKKYLILPYGKGRCFSRYLQELDSFRVIEAKSDRNVTVILGERKGVYHRFVVVFDQIYANFVVREIKDVPYDTLNFTAMESRLCLLLASPTELEICTSATVYETLSDPPLDSTMRLFSDSHGAFFINGNSIYKIKRK